MHRIIITFSMLLFIGGCAFFTPFNLNVVYDLEKAKKGPLSSIKPLNIEVGKFADKRKETDRNTIGYMDGTDDIRKSIADGWNKHERGRIVTKQPVSQIVRDAFITEFKKNGHLIDSSNKDISISGSINSFWFYNQVRWTSLEFLGKVSVDLKVINGKTGEILLTKLYQGYYTEKGQILWRGTCERVMNVALEQMIQQVSTDARFLKVLQTM